MRIVKFLILVSAFFLFQPPKAHAVNFWCYFFGIFCPDPTINQTQNLSFGAIDAGNGGTISTNGVITGDVTSLSSYQNGTFRINGRRNRYVEITITSDGDLNDGGNSVDVDFEVLEGSIVRLNKRGYFDINVVGTLTVNSGDNAGNYDDTFDIDVAEY